MTVLACNLKYVASLAIIPRCRFPFLDRYEGCPYGEKDNQKMQNYGVSGGHHTRKGGLGDIVRYGTHGVHDRPEFQ